MYPVDAVAGEGGGSVDRKKNQPSANKEGGSNHWMGYHSLLSVCSSLSSLTSLMEKLYLQLLFYFLCLFS